MDDQEPESVDEAHEGPPVEVVLSRAKHLHGLADADARLLDEWQETLDGVAAAHREVQRALDRTLYPALERLVRAPIRRPGHTRRLVLRCALTLALLLLILALLLGRRR